MLMKKTILFAVMFISISIIISRVAIEPVSEILGYKAKAGIKISSQPEAVVVIDGKEAGKTPFQSESLSPGEYLVKLKSSDTAWQGDIKLTKGTITVINRELTANSASSSGEVLTLSNGSGVVVTSSPGGSDLEIDGKYYGQTPISISDLKSGEHNFIISHDNYLKRSIRALLPEKLSLHLNVDLAITEADFTTSSGAPVVPVSKVKVLQTPTGFLRVRDKPSLQGVEIAKVYTGDQLTIIEDLNSWIKVRLENGPEGYVSSSYVQKL